MSAGNDVLIQTKDLTKTYEMGAHQEVRALCEVTLTIRRNEYVAIMGPSGSGKSTLMNSSAASTRRPRANTRSTAVSFPP
jgi:ABC-type lipoprotein export system ATPase subunit